MTTVLWRYSFWATVSVVCTAAALWVDLGQWARGGPVGPGSEWFRFMRTVAAVVPVAGLWRGRAGVDARWLTTAMVLVIVADTFLILRRDLLSGIAWFAIVQAVFVGRHGRGVPLRRWVAPDARIGVGAACVVVAIVNAGLWPSLADRGLALPVLGYSVLVMTTVVVAWGARSGGPLLPEAARDAYLGMVLFALCDVTVGVGAAFGHTSGGALARSLTGLLYTPALLLLVWSGRSGDTVH